MRSDNNLAKTNIRCLVDNPVNCQPRLRTMLSHSRILMANFFLATHDKMLEQKLFLTPINE